MSNQLTPAEVRQNKLALSNLKREAGYLRKNLRDLQHSLTPEIALSLQANLEKLDAAIAVLEGLQITPALQSILMEFAGLYREYRVTSHIDYNVDVTCQYRMDDLMNDVRNAFTVDGQAYAEARAKAELNDLKDSLKVIYFEDDETSAS